MRSRILGSLLMLVISSLPPLAVAASHELFGAGLGDWLRRDAQPELSTLLSKHPRFQGERISVVAMKNGVPASRSDGLTQAIRDQLTHTLTRVSGVQLVWREPGNVCGLPKKTAYLLGVEVEPEGRSSHLVRIAMVDVEEGVWVSGAHLLWRGALSQRELRAYATDVVDAPAGTIDKPLPASAREEVVEQLIASTRCALPGVIEGSVHIASADQEDVLLVDLARQMRMRLLQSAWLTLADDPQSATWRLQLRAGNDLGSSVVARLVANDESSPGRASAQRLAEVYVERAGRTRVGSARVGRAEADRTGADRTRLSERLIAGLHRKEPQPGDACYGASSECLEVEFDLVSPAYLMVLRTGEINRLSLGSCKKATRTSGLKRFRLAADAKGFYVLATTDSELATKVHTTLREVSANCSRNSRALDSRSQEGWLAQLDGLMNDAPGKLHWQAYYVTAGGDDQPQLAARATASSN